MISVTTCVSAVGNQLGYATDGDTETELQRQAVAAIGRRQKDEAVPILIRVARSHPKMGVRKQAIQVLGKTGDERAAALFRELLSQ